VKKPVSKFAFRVHNLQRYTEDSTSMLTLKMTYKETRQMDLQFTNTKAPYRCLVGLAWPFSPRYVALITRFN
jgi:hypothetical protein